jgi:vacuolar-type H+-ATPase subunit H
VNLKKRRVRGSAMPEEIRDTIKEIEKEAEKLIEKARAEARGILEDANKKAREILSEDLPLDAFKGERDKILTDAQEEAKQRIEESRKASAGIRSASSGRVDEFSRMMADQVRGIRQ